MMPLISDEEIANALAEGVARRAADERRFAESFNWPKRSDFYGGPAKTPKSPKATDPNPGGSDYYYPGQDPLPYPSGAA